MLDLQLTDCGSCPLRRSRFRIDNAEKGILQPISVPAGELKAFRSEAEERREEEARWELALIIQI